MDTNGISITFDPKMFLAKRQDCSSCQSWQVLHLYKYHLIWTSQALLFFFPLSATFSTIFSLFFKQVWGSGVEWNGQRPTNYLIIVGFFKHIEQQQSTVQCQQHCSFSWLCAKKKKNYVNLLKFEMHAVVLSNAISSLPIVMLCEQLWTYQLCAVLSVWFVQK